MGGLGDLLPQVGRGTDEEPVFTVTGDRDAGLGGGADTWITRAGQAALVAPTIPLWKTASGSRPEHEGNRVGLPILLGQSNRGVRRGR